MLSAPQQKLTVIQSDTCGDYWQGHTSRCPQKYSRKSKSKTLKAFKESKKGKQRKQFRRPGRRWKNSRCEPRATSEWNISGLITMKVSWCLCRGQRPLRSEQVQWISKALSERGKTLWKVPRDSQQTDTALTTKTVCVCVQIRAVCSRGGVVGMAAEHSRRISGAVTLPDLGWQLQIYMQDVSFFVLIWCYGFTHADQTRCL